MKVTPLGAIESPRPATAVNGRVTITGWCTATEVRVRLGDNFFPTTRRIARPDVCAIHPDAAVEPGFLADFPVPSGVHRASLEARDDERGWITVAQFTVSAAPLPFTAVIEHPLTSGTLRDSRRISGWAAHPRQRVQSLWLRYGHCELACDYGQPRGDVPLLFPGATHLTNTGFESSLNLPAGRGPLRVKAILEDGSVAIASTPLTIDIASDENGGTAPPADAVLATLPRQPRSPSAPTVADQKLFNVLFVLHGNFVSNSARHVTAYANHLADRGHDCVVAVPAEVETLRHLEAPRFRGIDFATVDDGLTFRNGRGPDIVHAWTTREAVRTTTARVLARQRAKLVIHLEDNEQQVLAQTVGRPFGELIDLDDAVLDGIVPPDLSHPRRSREFLAAADGITLITSKLREFAPVRSRCLTLWPAADERYFVPYPVPTDFRRALGAEPDTTILFYHGNAHAANAAEMRELYAAVARLNSPGTPVLLIRAGLDTVDFLGAHASRAREHVIELGQILQHGHLPPLMALADIFVQPGLPDAFNDYRFPSKLPEFFSIGRPVVLPRTNLGEHIRHRVDAYVLERADAEGIARAVTELRVDRALAERLGRGALEFAEKNFSWRRSAEALAKFYAELTTSA